MIWQAPSWSAASVQYTHGFPRRLVAESHGDFLPANITITSKASNLSLCRLAICDVAAVVSRQCISGAGLSMARLLNLRYAAIKVLQWPVLSTILVGRHGQIWGQLRNVSAHLMPRPLSFSMIASGEWGEQKRKKGMWVRGSFPQVVQRLVTRPWSLAPFPSRFFNRCDLEEGTMHGSSAGTENPLRSLLASFVSGQSKSTKDYKCLSL